MNSERITRVTLDEAKRMKGQTDYARLDAMTDEDIARAVAEDPDAAPLDIDWDKASLVIPHTAKDIITLRVDHDVLEWLRSTGKGYQTRINQVLRAWYDQTLQEKGLAIQKAAEARAAKKAAEKLKRNVEPSVKKHQAHWKKFHAAGPGFRAHGSGHAHGAAKKSAAKRSARKTTAKRTPR
jgi:uncharacterized protein (DUF4415 family)